MLEYCLKVVEWRVNNEIISRGTYPKIINKTEKNETTTEMINWKNLNAIREIYSYLTLPFGVKETKKGRVIIYEDWETLMFSHVIKEWKTKNLNMTLKIYYKDCKCSLKDILNYRDSDVAIEYLMERGIKFVQNYY